MLRFTLVNVKTWIVQPILEYMLDTTPFTRDDDPRVVREDHAPIVHEDNPPSVVREDERSCPAASYTSSSDPSSLYSIVSSMSLAEPADLSHLLNPSDDENPDGLFDLVIGTVVSQFVHSDESYSL
jgi:hypothetical protein